jgi:hypothetical protein
MVTDNIDPSPTISCTPSSPYSVNAVSTLVNCTATDSSGNTSPQCSFIITAQSILSLGGFVLNDLNANGIQDVGETGIGGVLVKVFQGASTVASTTTTPAGYYQVFLPPGSYSVFVQAPIGFTLEGSNPKSVNLNANNLAVDFAFYPPCIIANCNDNNPCTDDSCGY